MRTRREFLALGVGAAASAAWAGAAASKAVRIGVVATLSPGTSATLLSYGMRPLRAYLEEQTGHAGEVVRGGDAFELGRSLHDGGVQVAIFHGHEFAWAKVNQPTLEPIVVCINPLRSVRAYLVASQKFNGTLQGGTIAIARDAREHVKLYFERRCAPAGSDVSAYYRKISRPAESDDALDEAAAGKVQAAVVDGVSLTQYQQKSAGRARNLRVIYQSEEFPPGVLAFDPTKFPQAEAMKIRAALVAAKEHPRGRQSLSVLKLASFETPGANLGATLEAIATAYPPDARREK